MNFLIQRLFVVDLRNEITQKRALNAVENAAVAAFRGFLPRQNTGIYARSSCSRETGGWKSDQRKKGEIGQRNRDRSVFGNSLCPG